MTCGTDQVRLPGHDAAEADVGRDRSEQRRKVERLERDPEVARRLVPAPAALHGQRARGRDDPGAPDVERAVRAVGQVDRAFARERNAFPRAPVDVVHPDVPRPAGAGHRAGRDQGRFLPRGVEARDVDPVLRERRLGERRIRVGEPCVRVARGQDRVASNARPSVPSNAIVPAAARPRERSPSAAPFPCSAVGRADRRASGRAPTRPCGRATRRASATRRPAGARRRPPSRARPSPGGPAEHPFAEARAGRAHARVERLGPARERPGPGERVEREFRHMPRPRDPRVEPGLVP